jgi:hypothetical protein
MRKLLLSSVAALFLATGAAHALTFGPGYRSDWCIIQDTDENGKAIRKKGPCKNALLIRGVRFYKEGYECKVH